MTVTIVPQPLPLDFCGAVNFAPQRVDYTAPETSGKSGGVQAGFPRWLGMWTVGTISRRKSDELCAFVDARRGAQRLFYGYEVGREIPRFHQGGIPFTATPGDWSQAVADDGTVMLTLEDVMPGMVISHRDYVGFKWDGWKRALVRSIGLAVAQADRTITFPIEPSVPTLVPEDATATLSRPDCLMKLDPQQTQIGDTGRKLAIVSGKIVGLQELIA